MYYYKIDSRACGKGKTYDGIYTLIRQCKADRSPILLVVGSIELQNQYKKEFPEIILINSQSRESTVSRVLSEMNKIIDGDFKIICITHQTFMMIEHVNNRSKFMLIIDEAIQNIHNVTKFTHKKDYKWSDYFEIGEDSDDDVTYEEYLDVVLMDSNNQKSKNPFDDHARNIFKPLNVTHRVKPEEDNIMSQVPKYKEITDPNFDHYISPYDYYNMMNSDNTSRSFEVYSLLNQNIFKDWGGIHIAAAAFEKTPMFYLFEKFGLYKKFTTIHEFEPNEGNFALHSFKKFKWSNNKRKNNPEILDHYHDYVNRNSSGLVLSLRNKGESSTLDNELSLTHNVHGLNKPEYQSVTDISMESALLPSQYLGQFLKSKLLSDINKDDELNDIITHFFSAYLFYQAIMRCKLRSRDYDGEQINIFVLDYDVSVALMEYFNFGPNMEHYIIPDIPEMIKKTPMTNTERARKSRAKKKELELQRKKNAEYKKKSRDKKKNLTHLGDSSLNIRT